VPASLGLSGCRNIRDGGETVKDSEPGPFMTYMVYRPLM